MDLYTVSENNHGEVAIVLLATCGCYSHAMLRLLLLALLALCMKTAIIEV